MTESLRFEAIKISVDFSFKENSGGGGNLSWVGFVHILSKREDITDKRIETKAQM